MQLVNVLLHLGSNVTLEQTLFNGFYFQSNFRTAIKKKKKTPPCKWQVEIVEISKAWQAVHIYSIYSWTNAVHAVFSK